MQRQHEKSPDSAAVAGARSRVTARARAAARSAERRCARSTPAPMDIADGKHVAEMDCAALPQRSTASAPSRARPHIAGQRPAYLYLDAEGIQIGRPQQRGHDQRDQVPQRRRADQSGGLFRQPRSRAGADRSGRARQARSGGGRQGGGGGLRRLSRQYRRQPDPRHSEPDRARPEIPGRRDEGVQRRPAQERHHEGDAGIGERCGDEQRRAVLRAAKAGARQDAGRRRRGRRQGRRGKLRRMPRRGWGERQSGDAEPGRTGRAIRRGGAAPNTRTDRAPTTR